jgi:hypothetical protein
MKIVTISCLLFLLLTRHTQAGSLTTEHHEDIVATALQNNKLLTRVVKYVNI